MGQAVTKAALADRVRRERAELERLLAEVGEARIEEPGPMGQQVLEAPLAHLEAWQRYEQGPLEQALAGERPAPPWPAELNPHRDQDRINRFVYEATHDLPLAEVLRRAWQAWDRLEEGLAALPEQALTDPRHFAWMGGEALGPAVLHHVAAHYHEDHEADVRAWLAGCGRSEPGTR